MTFTRLSKAASSAQTRLDGHLLGLHHKNVGQGPEGTANLPASHEEEVGMASSAIHAVIVCLE